jgi:uncharacterized protein
MHVPSITAFYLAILALIYAVLALRVAGLRRANLALFGDAENAKLRTAIRVHANFIEYVPIITLLVALLEMSGMPPTRVHLLMGGLLLSRLLHPMGMAARPGTWQFNARPGRRHPAHPRRADQRRHQRAGALLANVSTYPQAVAEPSFSSSITLF